MKRKTVPHVSVVYFGGLKKFKEKEKRKSFYRDQTPTVPL